MILKSLEISNFRNLKNTKLSFSPQTNIFFGNNAQGKTNLIEAIYLLSFLKSFRAETDRELIQWDQASARIKGEFDSQTLSIEFSSGNKVIRLNNTLKRALEVLGELRVSSFAPEDILIVTGAPALRRRFIDSLIATVDRKYLYDLVALQKVLRNRNRVLFFLREGRRDDLRPWDDQLSEVAANLWLRRLELLDKLKAIIRPVSKKLLGGGEIILNYQPKIEINENDTTASLQTKITSALSRLKPEEIRRATTLIGPQRDDFSLILEEYKGERFLSKDVGVFGSRGEQRVGILALKLGELSLIEKEVGERPVLLLDDVLSEFDQLHRDHLFGLLKAQQTFITTTDLQLFPDRILKDAQAFSVTDGEALPSAPKPV